MELRATSYHSQGLSRALGVLRVLGSSERALSLAELAKLEGLPKSTLLRLLSVLESENFVYRDQIPPVYSLGHALFEISETYRRQGNVASLAAPHLKALAQATGLTANVGVLEGKWVLHICVEEPDRPLRYRSSQGSLDHTYCTGLGKMLLSSLSREQMGEHIPEAEPYSLFTDRTLANRDALDVELAEIRSRGYSVDDEERDVGVVCLAVPIPNSSHLNVALSVAGPAGELIPSARRGYLDILQSTSTALGADSRFIASLKASRAMVGSGNRA